MLTVLPDRPTVTQLDLRAEAFPPAPVDGLYVHIPFCFHKCHYCDFYSITKQTPERMDLFVDRLLAEADLWRDRQIQARTIFFGGGTPSLLPVDSMRRLIEGLHVRFDLTNVEEWTVETNPATTDAAYCRMLRGLGVDRLSFGAQSFDPAELKTLERHHDPADVARSIDIARNAGFTRLNVDLIFAIPGQSLDSWQRSLDQAIALNVPHISAYNLTYEPNTAMTKRKELGEFQDTPDEIELAMLHEAYARLHAAGLDWYEISNYAANIDNANSEACRHNLVYWTGRNYVGLGPSAASHIEGHRFKNRPHLGEWESAVPHAGSGGTLPVIEHEILTLEQRQAERVMLQLRLRAGVRWEHGLRERYADTLARLIQLDFITIDDTGFRLTEKGIPVADGIAGEFL